MFYIFLDKFKNNLVKKIIPKDAGFTFNEDMVSPLYKVIEWDSLEIPTLKQRYDEVTNTFIDVSDDDLRGKDIQRLQEENLKLKLALAEIVEGGL